MKDSSPKAATERKSMLKEMLMTIIATTISIVLTFGTGLWLDERKKKETGRQMAMMVISDIDENVEAFKKFAKWEEQQLELARYVENHLNQIDQISEDTLWEVLNYIIEGDIYKVDDSKERIFNSSQDTWKNIDNALFINIVQSFYLDRRIYDERFEREVAYRFPVSSEDLYSLMTSTDEWNNDGVAAGLKALLPTRKVQLYFEYSPARSRELYSVAGEWQKKSDQCKFIMGITDEELQEYLNKQQRTGSPLSDRQLIGTWDCPAAIGKSEESIEFKRDHRFVHCLIQYMSHTQYVGKLIVKRTMEGTWRIEGDSLYRDYDSDFYELDRSNIEYDEDMKDKVEDYLAKFQENINQQNEQAKQEGSALGHRSNAAFIDRSGSKIELNKTQMNEDGKEETYTSYMLRVKN